MGCGCGNHKDRNGRPMPVMDAHEILPSEPCIFCAEKHLSYAYHISKEVGYAAPNRQDIIGALVAAQWHIYRDNYQFAVKLRNARHLIQERKESSVSWLPHITEMDSIVSQALRDTSAIHPPIPRDPTP